MSVITMKRRELHELLMNTPLSSAAKQLNTSYGTVRKAAIQASVPYRSAGDWSRINVGMKIPPVPLEGDPEEIVTIQCFAATPVEKIPVQEENCLTKKQEKQRIQAELDDLYRLLNIGKTQDKIQRLIDILCESDDVCQYIMQVSDEDIQIAGNYITRNFADLADLIKQDILSGRKQHDVCEVEDQNDSDSGFPVDMAELGIPEVDVSEDTIVSDVTEAAVEEDAVCANQYLHIPDGTYSLKKKTKKDAVVMAYLIIRQGRLEIRHGSRLCPLDHIMDPEVRQKVEALRKDVSVDEDNRLNQNASFNRLEDATTFCTGDMKDPWKCWHSADHKDLRDYRQ